MNTQSTPPLTPSEAHAVELYSAGNSSLEIQAGSGLSLSKQQKLFGKLVLAGEIALVKAKHYAVAFASVPKWMQDFFPEASADALVRVESENGVVMLSLSPIKPLGVENV